MSLPLRFLRRAARVVLLATVGCVCARPTPSCAQSQPAPRAAALTIVVIEGEDAVNIVQQKTAVAPLVEVRDRNDQPVAGAVVRFAIRSGRASFGGARTLTVTTNAAGRAAAAGLTPTGSGALQIGASAAFQGQSAAVTIVQTNVLTAAQAASVAGTGGAAGGGAGTGVSTTMLAAVGGAAAGGTLLVANAIGGSDPGPGSGVYTGTANYTFVKTGQSGGLVSAPGNVNGTCTWTYSGTASLLADFDTDPDGVTITAGRFEVSWIHTQIATSCPTTQNTGARSPGPMTPDLNGQPVANISFIQVDSGTPLIGGTQAQTWQFAGALSGDILGGTFGYSMSYVFPQQGITESVPLTTVPVTLHLVK